MRRKAILVFVFCPIAASPGWTQDIPRPIVDLTHTDRVMPDTVSAGAVTGNVKTSGVCSGRASGASTVPTVIDLKAIGKRQEPPPENPTASVTAPAAFTCTRTLK